MRRRCTALLLLASGLGWASVGHAEAPRLFVYGPRGTAEERRVMAVVADSQGRCVPASVPLRWSAEGAEVHTESSAGACVRWLRLRNPDAHAVLRLRVRGSGMQASAAVPMQEAATLDVRAERRGRSLVVTVDGVERETLSGMVFTADRQIPLSRSRAGLSARVPRGLLGVVVRSGAMVGVTAVRPRGRPGSPEVLVMAADLAIEGGGPPREVAFVAAADRRGRLSRELPLTIQSERGRLRSLRWLERGVAAIGLSAPSSVRSIDLRVGHRGEALRRVDLAVIGGWPVSSQILVEQVAAGFRVDGTALAMDGQPVSNERMRVRCGALPEQPVPARCEVPAGADAMVRVVVMVDGQPVPLASRRVSRELAPSVPSPTPVASSDWQLEAFVRGGYDIWERGALGGGARAGYAVLPWLRVGASLGYRHVFWEANDPTDQMRVLVGERRSLTGVLFGEASFGDVADGFAGAVRLEAGGGWTRSSSRLAGIEEEADVAHFTARLAGGPRLGFDALRIGADLGVSTGVDSSIRAWERTPLAVEMEVHVGVALR